MGEQTRGRIADFLRKRLDGIPLKVKKQLLSFNNNGRSEKRKTFVE